jgi:MSHA biogenesis protein MshG
MPLFAYSARDGGGRKIDGQLDSADLRALADTLSAQGLVLVRADAQSPLVTDLLQALQTQLLGARVGIEQMLLFCRQMGTLLRAGVPLLRALRALQESTDSRRFAEVLGELQQQLEGGRELSQSMRQHEGVFSPFMVNMVRVGEMTGRLSEVFNGLHAQLTFTRDSREQIRAALRYPLFVVAVALAAIIAVNLFVIPSFARIYRGVNADLPLITQALIGTSNLMQAAWPLLLAAALGLAVATPLALRNPDIRRVRDRLLLQLPIIGALVHKAALARFTRSFGLALDAGVPLVDALQVAADTADNLVLTEAIFALRAAAERGEALSRAARTSGVFTPVILQMITVGEESGALAEMMNEVAASYQREVDLSVKSLGAQIEPVLILFLGAFVLAFALGVFLPLWDLSRVAIK